MLSGFGVSGVKVSVAATCNLNCRYCYIPKARALKKINDETIARLRDDLALLKDMGFRHLTLWGAEPALTIDIVSDMLKEMNWKLRDIHTSTNMTVSPDKYVKAFENFNEVVTDGVRVQVSLDGDEWLNSMTRGARITNKVLENLRQVISKLNDMSLSYKLKFTFKSTFDSTVIEFLSSNPHKVHEWYLWWDRVLAELRNANKNPNVRKEQTVTNSIAIPRKYTKKNDENYAKLVEEVIRIGRMPGHASSLVKLLEARDRLLDTLALGKLTCSAGKTDIAYDRGLYHVCHRTYYFDSDEYMEECISEGYEEWWTSKFTEDVVKAVREKIITDDKNDLVRILYVSKGYHECASNKLSILYATIKTLAKAGLINDTYKDDVWASLLAMFLAIAHGCPLENYINCGTFHIMPASYVKLYGNGAFEKILDWAVKEVSK